MRVLHWIALLACITLKAQSTTVVTDASGKPIPYASVKWGKGSGSYSNEAGKVQIVSDDTITITISSIGYRTLVTTRNKIGDKIVLEDSQVELDAVAVVASKKIGEKKVKVINPNSFTSGCKTAAGDMMSVLIENPLPSKKTKLKSITLPFFTESITMEVLGKKEVVKKRPFRTYFRLTFRENDEGKPGNLMNETPLIFDVNEDSRPSFKVELGGEAFFLPENGCFVTIENMGEKGVDDLLKGDINYERPSDRLLLPYIMITDAINKRTTFYANFFKYGAKWYDISDLRITPKSDRYELENIGLGYEMEIYE